MADDDDTFEPLRSGSIKNSRDALIAHTALHEGCALITNEKRFAARAREQGVEVLTTAELLAEFGFVFLCLVSRSTDASRRFTILAMSRLTAYTTALKFPEFCPISRDSTL